MLAGRAWPCVLVMRRPEAGMRGCGDVLRRLCMVEDWEHVGMWGGQYLQGEVLTGWEVNLGLSRAPGAERGMDQRERCVASKPNQTAAATVTKIPISFL